MEAQEVVKQGCRRRIGDGSSTTIWKVPWLLCPDNGFLTTDMPEELQHVKVQNLMDESQKRWDEDVLSDILNERDRILIRQLPISQRRRDDSWFWMLEEKGQFTVKSCYRKLRGEAVCTDGTFWNKLWGLKLPGKVVNLIWRACRDCLPSCYALAQKNVEISPLCSWCQTAVEDNVHVLFNCSFAREVWENAGLLNLVIVQQNDNVLMIMKRIFSSARMEHILMVSMLCWNIWQRRNDWIWNHINTSAFGIKSRSSSMLAEWNRAAETNLTTRGQQQPEVRTWCKPPAHWIKINTDAACMRNADQVGVGCIVRDEGGNFLRARNTVIQGRFQHREAEAIGLKEALGWMKNWRNMKCIFECDSKLLVDAINGSRGNTYFHAIVENCIDLLKHFDEVLISFAFRSTNTVAHELARASYSMSGPTEWLCSAPEFIICNLESDIY